MIDLTSLLPGDPISALTPTSQAGGNVTTSNENAMTAPGDVPAADHSSVKAVPIETPTPKIQQSGADIKPGTDGHPQPGQWSPPGAPSWKNAPAHSN